MNDKDMNKGMTPSKKGKYDKTVKSRKETYKHIRKNSRTKKG